MPKQDDTLSDEAVTETRAPVIAMRDELTGAVMDAARSAVTVRVSVEQLAERWISAASRYRLHARRITFNGSGQVQRTQARIEDDDDRGALVRIGRSLCTQGWTAWLLERRPDRLGESMHLVDELSPDTKVLDTEVLTLPHQKVADTVMAQEHAS